MIKELQLRISPREAFDEDSIKSYLQTHDGLRCTAVRVLKRSIDARQRQVYVNLTVRAFVGEKPEEKLFEPIYYPDVSEGREVIVVGAGPGGLFAALKLIEMGLRPIVLERGKDVHERKKDLARIRPTQTVDPESNYSFGEGGAGAYSDGKLFTRSKKRGDCEKILKVFVQHGASESILVDAHPHIGTDRLPRVIENMRGTILRCGGEVHFQTKMKKLLFLTSAKSGGMSVRGVLVEDLNSGTEYEIVPNPDGVTPIILATGHSARDVYRLLSAEGIEIEAKGIAVGVRLEHPSHLIDQIQYHSREGRGKWLPAAEYSMVTQADGRGVYSFCMCPGGFVVPAASGPGQIVVNGMSPSNRGGKWSNSGMVVEIRQEDLEDSRYGISDKSLLKTPLAMLAFQEELERLCWLQGNRLQTAPAQRMADFVNNRLSADLNPSSYAPGLIASPLHFWMPKPIVSRLQEGFRFFGKHHHGFLTNEATMIAVETRTSAPVRVLRDRETLQHVSVQGLYPCGEGAGYAGGIVSAGVDGERCAEMAAEAITMW